MKSGPDVHRTPLQDILTSKINATNDTCNNNILFIYFYTNHNLYMLTSALLSLFHELLTQKITQSVIGGVFPKIRVFFPAIFKLLIEKWNWLQPCPHKRQTKCHSDIRQKWSMPRHTVLQRSIAMGLLDQGLRNRVVAARMHCHPSTLTRLRQRLTDTGRLNDRMRSGRPRITSSRQDRAIRRAHIQDRFANTIATARSVRGSHGRHISTNTVRRRLGEGGLRSRIPYRGPILSRDKREKRLQWTRARQRFIWNFQIAFRNGVCLDSPNI